MISRQSRTIWPDVGAVSPRIERTQVDLPHNTRSGLSDAIQRLEGVKGVAKVKLTGADIVRHELVQRIVDAYERETNGAKVKRTQQGRL